MSRSEASKERARQRAKDWYYANRDCALARNAQYREEHRAEINQHIADYYRERPELRRAHNVRWRAANTERIKTSKRQYYLANIAAHAERSAAWREANPEKERQHQYERRLLRRGAPMGKVARQYVAVIRDDVCAYCGNFPDKPEIDHIVPISEGGTSEWDNLSTACRKCNAAKAAKPLIIYLLEAWA